MIVQICWRLRSNQIWKTSELRQSIMLLCLENAIHLYADIQLTCNSNQWNKKGMNQN